MATNGESSSASPKSVSDKPVIVRVKRKVSQSPLDAFWLEINERPLKRPLLDFEKLSISDSAKKEELKSKKVLVQHVETIKSPEATIGIVQSFVTTNSDATEVKVKSKERKHTFKKDYRQDQLLSKARQQQELLAKNARFEQIWRSRKGNKEAMHDEALHEMCRFYDVVRVDGEERSKDVQVQEDTSLEDQRIMSSYLPLLREFIPSAVEEIESDIHTYMSRKDDYVYDYYTVKDEMNIDDEAASNPFPLVQVEDQDLYDGPDDSEYDSEDSNAEGNPINDYPDEVSEEDEEEGGEKEEDDEDEEDVVSKTSDESEDESSGHDLVYEDGVDYDNCDDGFDFDHDDGEDWQWSYR